VVVVVVVVEEGANVMEIVVDGLPDVVVLLFILEEFGG